jgi:CRP/FNR family transcriptional regulator, anaerobic regulatory protein
MTDLEPPGPEDILQRLTLYRDAPPDVRSSMLRTARHVRLAPGHELAREGERASQVAVVINGSVRVFRIGATGRQVTLYHVRSQEASLVSMLSALLDLPAVATAQVEVETEAVVLPAAAVREWASASEAVRRFIFGTATRALVDVTSLLEDVAFRSMASRLGVMLTEHADAAREIRMRHEDIAAELGTAREVVSRLLEGFERAGAIELSRGRIRIRDEVALHSLASVPE